MNQLADLIGLVRRLVREELAARRGPALATVSAVYAHSDKDDTSNYEADVRLKHDGLELKQVPIAVAHIGVAEPPRADDLVLVQFVDGDLQQPLITGRFYDEDQRPPLFQDDDLVFEHRLSDGKINHLRFAADGTIYLQREVKKPEDNSEFVAGIKLDPDGNIELKTGDKTVITLKDGEIDIQSDGNPIKLKCDELTLDGKLHVTGESTFDARTKIMGITLENTDITGGS